MKGVYIFGAVPAVGPVSVYATRSLIDFSIQEIDMSAPATPV